MDRDTQARLDKLTQVENAVGEQHYNLKQTSSVELQILIDNRIEHGLFKRQDQYTWYTSSQTFRAMKKDIFGLEGDILMQDLEDLRLCTSCSKFWDAQFWNLCPRCLKELK